ncbi:Sec-independent protein translocase protein TatB [Maricaulis sp.]|uniref:Sec-independent protein translocase protein TatB n=1 Tax=Maricaulis sp. TaxID=1486257 RepID=UPI002601985E|nr:Sec-independent protein translocase protein TatB [Maricaulis sp.]MDF1769619.1 Sec-independent protein translocase protein TatB [Maricaulis sp.]
MSPGIGMPELLVVLVLALVVVGPQQLPVMMRKVGQMMAQARAMAKDFQNSFEEIGRETELSELRREIEALKDANPINQIHGELDKAARGTQDDDIRALKLKHAEKGQAEGGDAQSEKPAALDVRKPESATPESDAQADAAASGDAAEPIEPASARPVDEIKGR